MLDVNSHSHVSGLRVDLINYERSSKKKKIEFVPDLRQCPLFPTAKMRCGVERSERGSDISISCHILFSGRSPRPESSQPLLHLSISLTGGINHFTAVPQTTHS